MTESFPSEATFQSERRDQHMSRGRNGMKTLMATLVLAGLSIGTTACTTTDQRIGGAAVGGVFGAAVAGPVGAAAGAAAGAAWTPNIVR